MRYEELGGGITNHNYIIWVDGGPPQGKKYVLRVPGTGTDMFIDREVERYNMIQAAEAGVGPAVAYQIDPEGAIVSDFVEGEIMHPTPSPGTRTASGRSVETVKVIHDKAIFTHKIQVFDMLRHYTKIAREIDAPMPPELESLLREMDVIEKATSVRPPRDVACHNDLLERELHRRRERQDVGHRLGVRRADRPVLRPRRLRHGAPVHARRGAAHHRDVLRRDGRGPLRPHDAVQGASRACGGACGP